MLCRASALLVRSVRVSCDAVEAVQSTAAEAAEVWAWITAAAAAVAAVWTSVVSASVTQCGCQRRH